MSSADWARPLGADADLVALQERLGYRFDDPGLLLLALSHGSWCAEHGDVESNERLEFLGDAIIELAVRHELYRTQPGRPEGELSKLRRSVVNTYALARVAQRFAVGEVLRLGRGEDLSGGRSKASLLCNTLEAVIGAVFLDGGWERAEALTLTLVAHEMQSALEAGPDGDDHKTRLQELAAQIGPHPVSYTVTDEGPEHEKVFRATVTVTGDVVGHGVGQSKKLAEQQAARHALEQLAPKAVPQLRRAAAPEDTKHTEHTEHYPNENGTRDA